MNIIGLFKKIGGAIVAFEHNPLGQIVTSTVAGMFGGGVINFTAMALRLINASTKAVSTTEVVFKDKAAGSSSAEKLDHARVMVNADLDVYREVADDMGQDFYIDPAEVDKLIEVTLQQLNQVQKTIATVKMTPKAKAA